MIASAKAFELHSAERAILRQHLFPATRNWSPKSKWIRFMVEQSGLMNAAKRLQVVTARTRSEAIYSAVTLMATMCAIARTELIYQDNEGVAAALQKARRIEALIRQRLDESPEIFDVELRAKWQKVQNQVAELERQLASRRRS